MTSPRRCANISSISLRREVKRTADHRTEIRVPAKGAVALDFRGSTRLAPLLDRSPGGLQVKLGITPRIGETVHVTFHDGQRDEGEFVWVRGGKAGIRFG